MHCGSVIGFDDSILWLAFRFIRIKHTPNSLSYILSSNLELLAQYGDPVHVLSDSKPSLCDHHYDGAKTIRRASRVMQRILSFGLKLAGSCRESHKSDGSQEPFERPRITVPPSWGNQMITKCQVLDV